MTISIRRAEQSDAPALAAVELLTAPEFATFLLDDLFEGRSVGAVLSSIYAREGTDSWQWSWVAQEGDTVGAAGGCPVSLVQPATDTGEAARRLAYFAPVTAAMPDDAFHISRLGVLEPYRRRGVAAALLQAMMTAAGRHGEKRATLFVWEDNASARAFYDRSGFTEADRITLPPHPRALRHGTMLLMEKPLC